MAWFNSEGRVEQSYFIYFRKWGCTCWNKKVRRNPSQHGKYFSNRKIDTIMLLNTVYYLLIVMDTYKQYVGKIIYVKNSVELSFANTTYSNEIKRFYIRKKYVRKNRK